MNELRNISLVFYNWRALGRDDVGTVSDPVFLLSDPACHR